jgi:hypothetical protein
LPCPSRQAEPADGLLFAGADHEHIEERSDLEQALNVAGDFAEREFPLFLRSRPISEK